MTHLTIRESGPHCSTSALLAAGIDPATSQWSRWGWTICDRDAMPRHHRGITGGLRFLHGIPGRFASVSNGHH